MVGAKLSEFHTGLRAYSRELLEAIPYERNSEDFVFDNQVIVQALAAGARIGEVSCPTRYEPESSSINFSRSVKYGLGVLVTASQYRRHERGRGTYPYLEVNHQLEHAPRQQTKKKGAESKGTGTGTGNEDGHHGDAKGEISGDVKEVREPAPLHHARATRSARPHQPQP
jgi:hypothetical protein